jgi:hypothetical protein
MKFSISHFSLLLALFLIAVLILQEAKGNEEASQATPAIPQEVVQENILPCEAPPAEDETLWNSLSEEDQNNLINNQSVCKQEPSPTTETFAFTIYRLVDASALQAISIFWDTDMTKEILPNFQSMHVEKKQLNSVVATYTIGIPPAPWPYNTDTVKNTITLQKLSLNDYQISCLGAGVQGKSLVIKIEGSLEAVAHEGKTLLCYRSSTVLDKNAYFIKMSSLESQRQGARDTAVGTMNNFVTVIGKTTDFEKHITKVMTALGSDV